MLRDPERPFLHPFVQGFDPRLLRGHRDHVLLHARQVPRQLEDAELAVANDEVVPAERFDVTFRFFESAESRRVRERVCLDVGHGRSIRKRAFHDLHVQARGPHFHAELIEGGVFPEVGSWNPEATVPPTTMQSLPSLVRMAFAEILYVRSS